MDARTQTSFDSDACLDPLARIEADHAYLLSLCRMLETVADTLPGRAANSAGIANELSALLPLHHADEERGLFAILRRKCAGTHRHITSVMQTLSTDHSDEEALHEVVDYLTLVADTHRKLRPAPEAIGYALRGFFQAKRRHLSLETKVIMPFARKNFSARDTAVLTEIMTDNRSRTCRGDCDRCQAALDATLRHIVPMESETETERAEVAAR